MAALATAGYNIVMETDEEGNQHYYWQAEKVMINYKPTKLDYYQLAADLRRKGIWYFTDGDKYKTFISTDPLHISTESLIYCLMFFFGQ